MLSDRPGRARARSGTPHSGVARRGNSQNAASASGSPIATSRPIVPSRCGNASAPTPPSRSARRCSASSPASTATRALAITSGPWSSRKAANGANRAKPTRLRASRRLRSSLGLIASIAASRALPVSRPRRAPITANTAAIMARVSATRSQPGNGWRQAIAAVAAAARPRPVARPGGRVSSRGSRASAPAASDQPRAPGSSGTGAAAVAVATFMPAAATPARAGRRGGVRARVQGRSRPGGPGAGDSDGLRVRPVRPSRPGG